MKSCPSEKLNEQKIRKLIMSSLATGIPPINYTLPENEIHRNESIDFLHFIRYLNVVYKSDISFRLKFLYGVSMHGYIFLKLQIILLSIFRAKHIL
jgi:hypothetical protein